MVTRAVRTLQLECGPNPPTIKKNTLSKALTALRFSLGAVLLEIEPLDAIEWTPQAGIETGGNKRWHDMYKRILAAGKSVQVVNVELNEVQPLLDTIGPKGVYLLIQFKDEREAEQAAKMVEPYY